GGIAHPDGAPRRPANPDRELWPLWLVGPRDRLHRPGDDRAGHDLDRVGATWRLAAAGTLSSWPRSANLGETGRRKRSEMRSSIISLAATALLLAACMSDGGSDKPRATTRGVVSTSNQPANQLFGAVAAPSDQRPES